jgi:hypothetical protein
MSINVIQVPPSEGVNWLKRAWALTRANPLAVHAGMFGYLLLWAITSAIPLLGRVLPFIAVPVLYVGLMNVYRAIARKEPLSPKLMFDGFTPTTTLVRLLLMGALYGAAIALVFAITSAVDGGLLMRALTGAEKLDPNTINPTQLAMGAALALLLYTPVSWLFWMAPQFTAWHHMGVAKALFYSAMGCWRNIGAFALFFAATGSVLMAAALGVSVIGMLLGSPAAAQMLMLPVVLLLSVVSYVAFYISYESMVHETPATPAPDTTT